MHQSRRHRKAVLAVTLTALLVMISACSLDSSTNAQNSLLAPTPTGSPTPILHRGGVRDPSTSSPSVSTTQNSFPNSSENLLPPAFPHYFSFGVMNTLGAVSTLDEMRHQNGAAFAFRYQYLSGGVNTGHGWETWNQPSGQFITAYLQESMQHGYLPTFVYDEICQSNGLHPGTFCSGHSMDQDIANLANAKTMNAYFTNWTLMLQKISTFGKPTVVIVEPDLWGFLEQASHDADDASKIHASVSSSGYAAVMDYPNTAQGFAWALLHIRDREAPNAILALPVSTWATGIDIATDTNPALDVADIAQKEARFLNSVGLVSHLAHLSTWDLIASNVANYDAAQPGDHAWWDRYNQTFPNFSRFLNYIGELSQQTHHRIVLWQVPIGNQYFDTMNNTPGHFQDNRAEYILSNVTSLADAGIIAVLFGPGNGGTANNDTTHDGITNPMPITSYECDHCNNHVSIYPDDDGGYLRIFVGIYMQHPVMLGS